MTGREWYPGGPDAYDRMVAALTADPHPVDRRHLEAGTWKLRRLPRTRRALARLAGWLLTSGGGWSAR